jgi:5-methylcytosine-specific restriction endonuclease McrA
MNCALRDFGYASMPTVKANIPKALREQVWITYVGPQFQTKCPVNWCKNKISVFDFEVGHNIPESKGGSLEIKNLRPICGRCNKSMSDKYTIDEWDKLGGDGVKVGCCCW